MKGTILFICICLLALVPTMSGTTATKLPVITQTAHQTLSDYYVSVYNNTLETWSVFLYAGGVPTGYGSNCLPGITDFRVPEGIYDIHINGGGQYRAFQIGFLPKQMGPSALFYNVSVFSNVHIDINLY